LHRFTYASNSRKQPAAPYPSHFMLKRGQSRPLVKKQKVSTYDRDIVLLPPECFVTDGGKIRLPKTKLDWEFLVANKLIGKIQLRSDIDEPRIRAEIRSVFHTPMGCNPAFLFTFLQQSGGGCKFLMVPELSSSYRWTAGAVSGRNAKVPIYILAEDELEVGPSMQL